MSSTSTQRPDRRASLTRLLGSAGVVGMAAAVAALATFGSFTDSTTPAPVALRSGVVSIALSAADGSATVPLTFNGIVPGASATQVLDLVNDGDTALSSVRLATVATQSSVMDSDAVNGLQMSVRSCSVRWSGDGTCAGEVRTLLPSGPVVRDSVLTEPASLSAGAGDHLAVTLSLPTGAGNAFKHQSSGLALTFTAVQRAGAAR